MHVLQFMQLAYANRKSATKLVKVSLLPPTQLNYVKGVFFLKRSIALSFYHLTIVRQMNTRRQEAFFGSVRLDVVAHVDEPCFFCAYGMSKSNGFLNSLMTGMRIVSQAIDNEVFDTLEIGIFGVGNRFHVGDVGKVLNAEANNGKFAVHDTDGDDFNVAMRVTLRLRFLLL